MAQNAPDKITFSARLTDTSGNPITGSHAVIYSLFTVGTAGSSVWTESYPTTAFTADGLAFAELGTNLPLTSAIFTGAKLYLEVSVDGVAMTPRISIVSVPYAIRASEAASVGGLSAAMLQQRVSGVCTAGSAIRTVNVDGTVVCETVGSGSAGTITAVNTSGTSGLQGGVTTGAANIGLASCPATQILKSNGAGSWSCSVEAGATYTAGASGGLALTGTAFSLASCAANQILKATGPGVWACGADNSQSYSATDFIVNGSAVQTGNFNISGNGTIGGTALIGGNATVTGTGVILGNTQIGVNLAAPGTRLTVQGSAAVTGSGTTSGSATMTTLIGLGTLFNTEMAIGDRIIANGNSRIVTAIASNTSATVDFAWPADFFNTTFTIQKNVAAINNSAGTSVWAIDALGAMTAIRKIYRVQGYNPDPIDNGLLVGRSIPAFPKKVAASGVRVTWSDNFRVLNNATDCAWEVLFNGVPCGSPGGLYFYKYEGGTSSNRHDPSSFVGTCFGLAAGQIAVSTRVYGGGDCYTGRLNLFSIEAEEVF